MKVRLFKIGGGIQVAIDILDAEIEDVPQERLGEAITRTFVEAVAQSVRERGCPMPIPVADRDLGDEDRAP